MTIVPLFSFEDPGAFHSPCGLGEVNLPRHQNQTVHNLQLAHCGFHPLCFSNQCKDGYVTQDQQICSRTYNRAMQMGSSSPRGGCQGHYTEQTDLRVRLHGKQS